MRYFITLSYNGTRLSGWQVQPNAQTVQAILEDALSKLLREEISLTGAGRTDAGVSAIGYTAHFDAAGAFDAGEIGYKLNAILPPEIVIHSIQAVDSEMHARFSARRREYTYFLHRCKDPFAAGFSYFCGYDLDFDLMNKAAASLLGTHDFSCFEKTGGNSKTSICTIYEAAWHPYTPTHISLMDFGQRSGSSAPALLSRRAAGPRMDVAGIEAAGRCERDYWYFRIAADRFLRNMVRAIVGSLIEVGRGKRTLVSFTSLPDSGSTRSEAGESVPGHPLFLSRIDY